MASLTQSKCLKVMLRKGRGKTREEERPNDQVKSSQVGVCCPFSHIHSETRGRERNRRVGKERQRAGWREAWCGPMTGATDLEVVDPGTTTAAADTLTPLGGGRLFA